MYRIRVTFACVLALIALHFASLAQAQVFQNQWNTPETGVKEAHETHQMARQGQEKPDPIRPAFPPSNDACASAITLTPGAACQTGTTDNASTQGGEYLCINPGGGITPETVWYRFTATATSMVLGIVLTNTSNCATVLAVYGPFAPGGGCLPGAGNQILCQNMGLIDPGFHPLLSSLTVGQDYLVQVQGNSCGGGNDRFANYCISVNTLNANSVPGGANVINNCGTAFVGGTTGGHYASGTSIGNNNLDNNAATQVAGASEAGDDVLFVINNASWFTFCNGNAVSCNWSILLNNITGCLLSGLNAGVQSAVFTGNPTALTNLASSPSRIAMGSSWNSGTFTIGANACAYVLVDGFAGDECSYNLTLTNVSCPCVILPIEMGHMTGRNLPSHVQLDWNMNSVDGLHHMTMEHSMDGRTFAHIGDIQPNADLNDLEYSFQHPEALSGWNYYRLSAIDMQGETVVLGQIEVFRTSKDELQFLAAMGDNQMELFVNAVSNGPASITVLDLQGRVLLQKKVDLTAGTNAVRFSTSLSAGAYLVTVAQGAQVVTKRVSKL